MHLESALSFFLEENTLVSKLPMGIACSPDIFQSKMSDLMMALEYVRTYLDNLLIISKGNLIDHLFKLMMVLIKLQMAGLKINAAKSSSL